MAVSDPPVFPARLSSPSRDEETINGLPTFSGQNGAMAGMLSFWLDLLIKVGAMLLAANEIRGLVLAGPVLFAMVQAGGTLMALWIGFCSLAGIALSVIVPLFLARKLRLLRLPRPL